MRVDAGAVVRLVWQGPGADNDLIFITSRDLAENRYRLDNAHDATEPSPAVLVAPATPGDYEIRYYSRASGSVLARHPIDVTAARVTFDSPAEVAAGTPFEVAWTGPAAPGDAVHVAAPDMDASHYWFRGRYHDVDDGSPARLVAPAAAGPYEIRYYSRENGSVLARQPIEVTAAQVTFDGPAEVAAGTPFDVTWTGPAAPGDGLFVASLELDADRYWLGERYHDVNAGSPARLVAPAAAGLYEIRYYSRHNATPLGRQAIRVSAAAVSLEAPRVVAPGAELTVSWTGPNAPGDFLFVAPPDLAPDAYYGHGRHDTSDGATGTLTAPDTPGPYEIRYYSWPNGTTLAQREVVVR